MAYKALHILGPDYQKGCISLHELSWVFREVLLSDLGEWLWCVCLSWQACCVRTHNRVFKVATARLWSAVFWEVRLIPRSLSFQKQIMTLPFSHAFSYQNGQKKSKMVHNIVLMLINKTALIFLKIASLFLKKF